jgi:hypothetical protein
MRAGWHEFEALWPGKAVKSVVRTKANGRNVSLFRRLIFKALWRMNFTFF